MTDRPAQQTDGELVAAHLAGDPTAFAAIYDRYADPLHDTAAAMLSDHHDAEDMTHDVFVIAARRLDALRDPERLKPWLFSILRHEVYRRSKRRSRARATDPTGFAEMTAPIDPLADGADVERAELAAFVRAAAAGLAERDQLVLELNARQGLDGQDLADALGVSRQQSHVLLHRTRARVQRSLAALTVARHGRRDCPELQELLAGWDGTFDPRIRKRIAGHVDDCEICERTSRKFAAVPLLASAPVLAAPPSLRERVLASTAGTAGGGTAEQAAAVRSSGPAIPRLDAAGFPVAPGSRRLAPLLAVAATVALLVGGWVWLAFAGGGGPSAVETASGAGAATPTSSGPAPGDSSTTTAVAAAPPPVTDPDTTTTSTTTIPPTTTTSTTSTTTSSTTAPPPTAPPAPTAPPPTAPPPTAPPPTAPPPTAPPPSPGALVLSRDTIDLGDTDRQATLSLANTGELPLDWSIDGAAAPFAWSARSGTLAPGTTDDLLVSIDRSSLAEGSVNRSFSVSSSGLGTTPLTVLAAVERAPVVRTVTAPSFLRCPGPTGSPVVVAVADESPISGVVLTWSGPGGSGSAPMRPVGDDWEAMLAPAATNGDWTWVAQATDRRGNVGTVGAPFLVSGC